MDSWSPSLLSPLQAMRVFESYPTSYSSKYLAVNGRGRGLETGEQKTPKTRIKQTTVQGGHGTRLVSRSSGRPALPRQVARSPQPEPLTVLWALAALVG